MLPNLLLPELLCPLLLQAAALHLIPGRGGGVLLGSPSWLPLGIPQGDSGSPGTSAAPRSHETSTLGWDPWGRRSTAFAETTWGFIWGVCFFFLFLSLGLRLLSAAYHHTTLEKLLYFFFSSPVLQVRRHQIMFSSPDYTVNGRGLSTSSR